MVICLYPNICLSETVVLKKQNNFYIILSQITASCIRIWVSVGAKPLAFFVKQGGLKVQG